jgi:hypothetical protein
MTPLRLPEFRSKEEFHAFIVEDTEKMAVTTVGTALPRVK